MAHCYVHIDKLMLKTTVDVLLDVFLVFHSIADEIASILSLLSPEPAHLQSVVTECQTLERAKITNRNQKILVPFWLCMCVQVQ